MDWLAFVRGPMLVFSIAVCVLGTAWRLWAIQRLPAQPDRSPPRAGAPSRNAGALASVFSGLRVRSHLGPEVTLASVNAYVFHIGLALVVLGYAPHIAFVQRLTGLHWPALPDAVVALAAGATILSLLYALAMRMNNPVLRLISGPDDYISWTITFLPFVTGMAIISGASTSFLPTLQPAVYPGPLALHLLSLELLLIWFPFGKLMHAVLFAFSRSATGVRFSHRGVKV